MTTGSLACIAPKSRRRLLPSTRERRPPHPASDLDEARGLGSAILLALTGIVLALVSGSAWPRVAFAGLALPMMLIGSPRSATHAVAPPR